VAHRRRDVSYTLEVVVGVAGAVAVDLVVLRTNLLRRKAFWTAYAIIVFFQLVVNGLLTGLRIVRYNPHTILGWHVVYAPVEDLAFGFAMVTLTLSAWVWLGRRAAPSMPPSARPPRREHGERAPR
jgi:lycopene cyclase domain-containing protein